ncbi:MAG: GGDEF domain-containing protein [Clostridia bacterium]|nr:GGDEF domain-containing protein [Clostridia bacterium]NCC76237.1 GGDEF domain-containing protein [Clostridia bacterium]
MENRYLHKQFETEQYKNQSNLVYLSTMGMCAILAVIFLFVAGSPVVAALQVVAVLVSGLAIWLNRRQRYGQGSLLFISLISLMSVVEVLQFGLAAGFQYYFFNMAGLIMFTSWKPWQKWLGVLIDTALFVAVYFLAYKQIPPVQMSMGMIGFFHTLNVVLNVAGVANSASYYIKIATKAHHQVSNLAMKDYLTGLMNRTSFDDFMKELCSTQQHAAQGLAILMLDLDHFKRINDTCGHLCGDELLRQFAAILKQSIRSGDLAARYGGEEFAVVARMEDPAQAQDLAERLRHDVECMNFKSGGQEKQVTVSIGALFVPPKVHLDQNPVLDRADKLLYQAKAEGRNQVVFEAMQP